jgi:Predicted O-methyltransferase
MKVCTDACIFGAWVSGTIAGRFHTGNCLDIGTGTGLLGLMVAQKSTLHIDAVEIEENAYLQAAENFRRSPWNDRIQLFHGSINAFPAIKKYDLIISNPPFFENDLRSKNTNINIARHDESLTLNQLVAAVNMFINENGYFAVLLPYHRVDHFETLASQNQLFLNEKLLIRQTPGHDFFRGILIFSRSKTNFQKMELCIRNKDGSYTAECTAILKDFYLNI